MHHNEMWQEFRRNGERVMNGGRLPEKGNPKSGEEDVWTGSVILWLYRRTERGVEVLFQRRSNFVDRNPNKWDTSAGGHINYDESMADAAVREAKEEIGAKLDKEKLEYSFSLVGSSGYNILINGYFYDWTGREDDFCFEDNEVSEVRWVSLTEFDDFIENGDVKKSLKGAYHTLGLTKYWLEYYGNL
ncbi:NUDIX domain-containing protein [Candidatus Saccharibacteria bacterium]|nr:NUDIX domain-containing protein [Candidatus Saccharibacteria bacterium]